MTDSYAQRRQQALQFVGQASLDAFLVTSPVNVTYLTGFSGDSTFVVLGRQRTLLVSDGRYTDQLAEECPGVEAHIRPPSQSLPHATAEVLGKLGLHSVGFEAGHLTVADLEHIAGAAPTIDWKAASDCVEQFRAVKDATEVEQIREAIRIAERAFAMFRAMFRPSDSEKEMADAMETYVRRAGGRCSSFPPIIAVGERAALPHAPPTARTTYGAGLLLVDWGASGASYKSDLTRVLVPRKNSTFPEPKLQEVHAVVMQARDQALQVLRPGVKANEVDAAARAAIAAAGFGEYFTHSVGHGLGLQVHEAPMLRPNSDAVLQAGNVVTIEPGIYLPGWGGVRIEDDVLVTEDGYEVLTSVPRDLASLGVGD